MKRCAIAELVEPPPASSKIPLDVLISKNEL
jgi:hypothetical protein